MHFALKPGGSATLSFIIENKGTKEADIKVESSMEQGWADLSNVTQASLVIPAGNKEMLTVAINVPNNAALNSKEQIIVNVVENNHPLIADTSTNTVVVSNVELAIGDANGDGSINTLDIIGVVNQILEAQTNYGKVDCNQDGNTNTLDLICLINKILAP